MFPCRAPRRAESIRDEPLIHLIMGVPENQSSQNSNKRQRSEESDGSSDSDTRQPTIQVTSQSALNVPRFLVVQSADSSRKVSDLSPFVIEKCIVSLAGQPKSIKKLIISYKLINSVSEERKIYLTIPCRRTRDRTVLTVTGNRQL